MSSENQNAPDPAPSADPPRAREPGDAAAPVGPPVARARGRWGGAQENSGPRPGHANTAPARAAKLTSSALQKARRMSVIEDLMARRTTNAQIDSTLADKWGVREDVIRRLRREVEKAWHLEAKDVDRESHRVIATKMIETVYRAAMSRRRKIYSDGALVADDPDPNLTAAAIATRTYAKLHGLEELNVKVGLANSVIELLKLGATARSKQPTTDISVKGAILDVGPAPLELEESTGYKGGEG